MKSFSELEQCYQRNVDYRIITQVTDSSVAIVAPHGGKIETGTSEIAQAIAGDEFNFYLFEGTMPNSNYSCLHLSSHYFDDPKCLELIADCEHVISIHGCKGDAEFIYLGGSNTALKETIAAALRTACFRYTVDNSNYLGLHADNICNRGLSQAGVQIELSKGLRHSNKRHLFSRTVQNVLLNL